MSDTHRPELDLLTMGRSSIDLYAADMGVAFEEIGSFDAYVGGSPTNIAVGARRLGRRTGVLTGVGDDKVGAFIRRFLDRLTRALRLVARQSRRPEKARIDKPDHAGRGSQHNQQEWEINVHGPP